MNSQSNSLKPSKRHSDRSKQVNESKKSNLYKKVLIVSMVIATSLIATTGYSQVYVSAHFGFGVPVRRVYVAPPPPPAVYQETYAPAPEYAPAPPPVVYEQPFPEATYFTYPSWCGHYRDRVYFEHYRPWYEREHREHGWHGREYDRYFHHRW